jgi:hypothetical protein
VVAVELVSRASYVSPADTGTRGDAALGEADGVYKLLGSGKAETLSAASAS